MIFSYSNRSDSRGGSWEAAPAPHPGALETVSADVAVIGAGVSGLAAAVRCAQLGMSVIVAEKRMEAVPHGKYIGVVPADADRKIFAKEWLKACGSRVNEDLLWLYMRNSASVIDWLNDLASGEAEAVKCESIYKNPGISGYDGDYVLRRTGARYKCSDGGLLLEILEDALVRLSGRVLRCVTAEQLERNAEGRVVSFVGRGGDGVLRRYEGKKAVVLAAGDCGGDEEMLAALSPVSLKAGRNRSLNTGDGQKMAFWAGAELDGLYWAPNFDCSAYGPYTFFFTAVNRDGRRFMNEDTSVTAKARHCMNQHNGDAAFTIADDKWFDELKAGLEYVGGPTVAPCSCKSRAEIEAECGEYLFRADTLEELAKNIGVCPDALKKTAARVNELAAQGEDTDYGKRPELLTTIEKAPFYAFKWGPALRGTFGGAVVDTGMHVFDPDDEMIPGLYAVGCCAGGLYGVGYPALLAGSGFGSALTFALAAAEAIAKE